MKHLLTALIAALCLVLPLHADEPEQTVSVRVTDHEGEPIGGLHLRAIADSAMKECVTDDSGIARFELAVQPDTEKISVWPYGHSHLFVSYSDAEGKQEKPDLENFSRHAFERVTHFNVDDFSSGPLTIRVPRSVPCEIRFSVSNISPAPISPYFAQRIGGPNTSRISTSERPFGLDETGWFLLSTLAVPRNQQVVLALTAQGRYHIVELNAEQTDTDNLSIEIPEPEYSGDPGTIQCRVFDEPDVLRFCLIAVDGDHARAVQLTPETRHSESGGGRILRTRSKVPSGEFYIYPSSQRGGYWSHDLYGANFWSPGSVFDTLLRLRRGEDLPHLKRITIPEGGTVELSSEDFLDPPAEPEAKDATP